MEFLRGLYHSVVGDRLDDAGSDGGVLTAEDKEELRMLSGFEVKEIVRLYNVYKQCIDGTGNDQGLMSLTIFLALPALEFNPLKNRIAMHFGFINGKTDINFKEFVCGLALFNSQGQRDSKIKIAFQVQDFDDDGVLSKEDLTTYINLVTANGLTNEGDVEFMVEQLINESFAGQELRGEVIAFTDFQRLLSAMDFQAKMRINI